MHNVERHEPLSFAQKIIKTNPLAAICGKDPASTTSSTRVGSQGHWTGMIGRPVQGFRGVRGGRFRSIRPSAQVLKHHLVDSPSRDP
jgi:hypothetical protein